MKRHLILVLTLVVLGFQEPAYGERDQKTFVSKDLKQFESHVKQWNNPRKQLPAKLRIAQLYVDGFRRYEAAVEIYQYVEKTAEANPAVKGRQELLAEARKGLDKAMSGWVSSLDQPPVLRMEIKPKSHYYVSLPQRGAKPSGQISVKPQTFAVDKVQDVYFRVSLPQGRIQKQVWFPFDAASKFSISVPDARSFSLEERIQNYKNFLAGQVPAKYADVAIDRLDELRLAQARQIGTKNAYETYLSEARSDERRALATGLLEDFVFDEARKLDSEESYKQYLLRYPGGRYADQVDAILGQLRALGLVKKENTRAAYLLFLEQYPNSWYTNRARVELDNFDFASARMTGSAESYRLYLSQHPGGAHKAAATEAIQNVARRQVKVQSIQESYSESGVTFSGIVLNSNPFPVDVSVVLSFETKTENIRPNSNISRLQAVVYEGRHDSGSVEVKVPANGSWRFEKYFDTVAKGEYRGLILDLFNTEKNLRRRLRVAGAPSVKIVLAGQGRGDVDGGGNVEQAKAYLRLAVNAKSSEGVKNMLDALGHFAREDSGGQEAYRLKAQVGYAEDAVRVAPRYAPARLALAQYLYLYAESAIRPGTIFSSYLQAYEEASIARALEPGNVEAERLMVAAKERAEANALQAGVSRAITDQVQKNVLQFSRSGRNDEAVVESAPSGTYAIEGALLCGSETYRGKPFDWFLKRGEDWVKMGSLQTDSAGGFKMDTNIGSGGGAVSLKIVSGCGEGELRVSQPLSDVRIMLRR